MSKHTKGPWEAYNGEVTTQRVEGRSFRRIAAIQDYGVAGLPEVDEANAALIAAAPDLLEACKEAAAWLESGANGDAWALAPAKTLRAAISRAEGRA